MKNVYLVLAVVGAAIPYLLFAQHVESGGLGLLPFMAAAVANPVAAGFTADLVISSLVFWICMFTAGSDAPRPWPFIVLNCLVGLSCALPAYLYWRSRA
jgi:hypothetical protein